MRDEFRPVSVSEESETGSQARKGERDQREEHTRREAQSGGGNVWAFRWLFYPCKPATVGETEVRSARWPAKGRMGRQEPPVPLEQL